MSFPSVVSNSIYDDLPLWIQIRSEGVSRGRIVEKRACRKRVGTVSGGKAWELNERPTLAQQRFVEDPDHESCGGGSRSHPVVAADPCEFETVQKSMDGGTGSSSSNGTGEHGLDHQRSRDESVARGALVKPLAGDQRRSSRVRVRTASWRRGSDSSRPWILSVA